MEKLLHETTQTTIVNNHELTNKHSDIYEEIITILEKEKPYCNPDFNIAQLATTINSNVTYISKAINIKANTNFNTLVNTYRVNYIEAMLKNGYHKKYTIRHIYSAAGFKHQTTFNKVFKQIRGITPSEYIRDLDKILSEHK
ncbi:AraC family transcriptional regulator [Dysgonomonas sp. OttesenSCG-928-M03]|nr:AraC family transcriptional regulator [Dysgonomonas sp. OttesenSCG-928-M03]